MVTWQDSPGYFSKSDITISLESVDKKQKTKKSYKFFSRKGREFNK
jgi:hypothetical protein